MRKRIIALLLALILTVGLLPTVALAAEGETPTTDSGSVTKEARKDNLNLVKTVTKDGENYKVTLESWATGIVTTTTETKPLDIVLLLDVSGSMDEKYSNETIEKFVPYDYRYINFLLGYETTNSDLNDYQDTRYGVWYKIPNSETYVSVKVEKEWKLFADDDYTYSYEQNGSTIIIEKTSNGNKPPKTQFYYKESANTTKLDALKTAVSAFIDNVATNSPNSNISIVKFADDSYKNAEGNDTFWQGDYEYNYTQIVKKLTKVNTAGVTALKKAISELRAGGATASDYGLNKAQEALKDAKQERVVILFTDGEPNHQSGFDKQVATDAVNKAKELKSSNPKTTIYTVGVFKNPSTDVNTYMSSVSSNYPNASAAHKNGNWKVTDGGSDFGKYYMNATSPVDLLKAFETISSEVSGGELGAEAVLTDVIAPNFALVAPEGMTGVTAYTVDKTADGWSTQKTTLTNGVTIGADGQVSVTGFDYSENCVTTTAKPTTNDYGKKLVVEFTIHHNNYGGTQPTNAGASIKDKAGKEVIKVDDPAIPVKITEPSITGVTRSKVYDGTGFDVLSTIAEDINALADGKKNAYVDIVVTVTSGSNTYTYTISKGATTGSWDKTGLTTEKDVKIENGAVSSYTYDLSITFKDATANGAADAIEKTTATYTITKRPVTLTSGSDEKKYDGTPLTKHEVTASTDEGVGFVGEDRATYTFTGSQTEVGESDNTFDYILNDGTVATNYEITKQVGKLKVTKDDTAKITVTITGTQETKEYNGLTQEVVGFTYTVEGGAAHNDVAVTLKTGNEAKASGKDVLVGTDGKYDAALTYPMHLAEDYFDVSSTKYSDVTIKEVNDGWLKITPIAITLKSGSGTKNYDGTALTKNEVTESGSFVTGEGLDYNVTGSQTEVGTSKNTYTYTAKDGTTLANYTIIKEEGDLAVTLPDLTTLPNVTVDCINSDVSHADMTGVTLTEAAQYSLGNSQKVENAAAYTRTVTLTEAGKGYCVSKYNETYGPHTPATTATTGNVTEITMTYSNVEGTWAWRATPTNFRLNVECTTPTVEVDLGNYVKKTLAGTNFHENFEATFTVEVTYTDDNDNGTATGSVRFTGADTKDFGFASTVELKKNHVYKFTATERADNVPGVVYDTKLYSFALKITAEGDVVFGSVVEGVFVANETEQKYVTITNTYTEPTYAVEKSVINDDASDNIPDSLDRDIYQYPMDDKYIVEKTYTSDTITFLYVIKVSGNQGAVVKVQETDDGEFVIKNSTDSRANIVWNDADQSYTVTLNQVVEASDPIKLYAKKSFHKGADGKFPTTATNALLVNGKDGPEKDTTIEERGTLTVDFGALVHKHLTFTGDKSFNGATFTVNFTEGLYAPLAVNNSIEVYADAGVGKEKLPDLTASVTYTADERDRGLKDFDGADLTINTEGNYSYIVSEQIPAGATGYDAKKYVVGIVVVTDGDGLKVEYVWYHELVEDPATHPEILPGGPTFYNTIDTGKDDYYPIIIPTIINKDTGMLNKTDHFAYVIGYPDGTVHPNGQITRAEVATIFFRLLRDEVRDGAFTTSNTYSDVAYGKWYNNPISTMSALGIITGYPDGTFKPNKPITRAEFAAIAARFDETQSGKSATFSDVIGHWAAKEIGIAYYNDWIKGYPDGTFKPDQNITRAEAMTLINRVLERKPESPADLLTNMNKWTDNMDTSKWYYLDVQEATNSHGYTRKTFNYELWRQMLPDPDWSRYER